MSVKKLKWATRLLAVFAERKRPEQELIFRWGLSNEVVLREYHPAVFDELLHPVHASLTLMRTRASFLWDGDPLDWLRACDKEFEEDKDKHYGVEWSRT